MNKDIEIVILDHAWSYVAVNFGTNVFPRPVLKDLRWLAKTEKLKIETLSPPSNVVRLYPGKAKFDPEYWAERVEGLLKEHGYSDITHCDAGYS